MTIQHREFGRSEIQNLHFIFMPRALRGKQIAHYSVNSINSIWNVAVRRAAYAAVIRIQHVIRLDVGCCQPVQTLL